MLNSSEKEGVLLLESATWPSKMSTSVIFKRTFLSTWF